ncbi:transposase (fragment) [Xenorhabdus bovienii str. Jollieti]|uniref:Transposase n=1 Tax=Xenorhabdus bovienii (strain SS-2004) TaxID=406818 RepID=D3V2P3_XENBS
MCQNGSVLTQLFNNGSVHHEDDNGWYRSGKNVFQIHGVDAQGKTVLKKQLPRAKMLTFFVNLPPCLIGMEACGGAHYWARKLRSFGHDTHL